MFNSLRSNRAINPTQNERNWQAKGPDWDDWRRQKNIGWQRDAGLNQEQAEAMVNKNPDWYKR